jgi:transcriptional regulator with XRE-family HTH domain
MCVSAVGEIIKEKRKEKDISQNQLAKRAGIAQATLSAIESSTKSPAVDTVEKLAAAFECSISELLGEKMEGQIFLSDQQKYLLDLYSQMNDAGRNFLLQQAESILQQSAFRKDGSASLVG